MMQLVFAFSISLAYLLLVSTTAPFVLAVDDAFAKACSFSLTACFFLCVSLKQQVLMQDILADAISDDVASQYVLSSTVINASLLLFIASAFVLAVIFGLEQMVVTARLPTLKLEATKTVPDLILRKHHHWHVRWAL